MCECCDKLTAELAKEKEESQKWWDAYVEKQLIVDGLRSELTDLRERYALVNAECEIERNDQRVRADKTEAQYEEVCGENAELNDKIREAFDAKWKAETELADEKESRLNDVLNWELQCDELKVKLEKCHTSEVHWFQKATDDGARVVELSEVLEKAEADLLATVSDASDKIRHQRIEIADLKTELAVVKTGWAQETQEHRVMTEVWRDLTEEIDRLKTALEFYGDKRNVTQDGGKRARDARMELKVMNKSKYVYPEPEASLLERANKKIERDRLLGLLVRWRNSHPCGRDDYKCAVCEDTDAALVGVSDQETRCDPNEIPNLVKGRPFNLRFPKD